MKQDLTDIVCGLVIIVCGSGLLYLLNPDFEHFITTEIQPEASAWADKNLPTGKDIKKQFMEGYTNGKGSHPNQQK